MIYSSDYFRQRRANRAEILERLAQTGDDILQLNDQIDEYILQKNPISLWSVASKYLRECKREYQEAQEKLYASLGYPGKEEDALIDLNMRKATIQQYISSLLERKQMLLSQPQNGWQVPATIERIDEFVKGLREIINE